MAIATRSPKAVPRMLPKKRSVAGLALALPLLASAAPAEAPRARDTGSIFFIAKSENHNQVHYVVRVDEDCRPLGPDPVHGFWRMLERGENAIEPLLGREGPAYGLADGQQVESTPEGWRIHIRLRALPQRPIDIHLTRENGQCVTRAWVRMNATDARLDHVFVRIAWPAGIDYVRLIGVDRDGHSLDELLRR